MMRRTFGLALRGARASTWTAIVVSVWQPLSARGDAMNPEIFDEFPASITQPVAGEEKDPGGNQIDKMWDSLNNPVILSKTYERGFSKLPLQGRLPESKKPWSDTYWPSDHGSIAYRWNHPDKNQRRGWNYRRYTKAELLALTTEEQERLIATLSPAEKYDLYMGQYDYPLTRSAQASSSPKAPDWAGICNGWSRAAIYNPEPKPVTVRNSDGISIPFGSSDIKGVMSYFYAFTKEQRTYMLGNRCQNNPGSTKPGCMDVNAGALHIVLTNQIGILQQAFVADVDRYKEVWNNPVYQYESTVIDPTRYPEFTSLARPASPQVSSAKGTVRRVLVQTKMTFTEEIDPPLWEAINDNPEKFMFKTHTYLYWLELGENDEILGGEWERLWVPEATDRKGKNIPAHWSIERPDFVWVKGNEEFKGRYIGLGPLLQSSLKQ